MAFWDDWQKNKNPITWSEGFQHGYKKIPKSSTPSSEELSLAKANKKLVGKEKLDKNMQDTVQKVVKNMIKEGNTSGRFDKNKPRDLDKFNRKFMDVSSTADSNSYTITSRIKRPFQGREYAHKTIHDDGTVTISYGPTPDPKDATDFIGKRSATKPTIDSAVKETTKPIDGSEAFIKGVARSAEKISNGKNIDPTEPGSLHRLAIKDLPNEAPRVDGTGVTKFETPPDEKAKASIESSNKKMSEKHFSEPSAEPTSNSTVKNSVGNKLKNSKVGNWLKNSKVGGYFTDSPLTPMNVALTHKGWTGQANPVAYAANAYGMGSGGGYMPVGEHTVDQLRIQHGQDEVSSLDTVVPMNPQGTMYLDPELGFQPTEVVEDHEGGRYYRNAQTGQFEPLDYNTNYTHISADQLARNNIAKAKVANFNKTADYLNDIISGVIKNIPQDISKLPLPSMSADTAQPVQPVVKPKRVVRPPVVNNTPVANVTPVQPPVINTNTPVAAPTLSSVVPQAVRHNGGFDNYRRESVLSALRAAGGISPAEAVQRGIIPWEALNYV